MERWRRVVWFAAIVVATIAVTPRSASASTGPSSSWLHYEAGVSCPSREEFLASVEDRVGPLGEQPLASAMVVVQEANGTCVGNVVLSLSLSRSEIVLEDRSCEVVVRAAAVKVAIAILDERAAATQTPDPFAVGTTPAPITAAQPDATSLSPKRAAITPHDRERWRIGARARAGVDAGSLPGLGPLTAADLVIGRRRLLLEAGAAFQLPRAVRLPERRHVGADFWSAAGRLAVCGAWRSGPFESALCGTGELGVVTARGVGLSAPRMRSVFQGALGPAARVGVHVRAIAFVLGGEVDVALPRHRFGIHDLGAVVPLAAVRSRVWLGVEIRIPTHGGRRSRASRQ